jgi:hypothetical protein
MGLKFVPAGVMPRTRRRTARGWIPRTRAQWVHRSGIHRGRTPSAANLVLHGGVSRPGAPLGSVIAGVWGRQLPNRWSSPQSRPRWTNEWCGRPRLERSTSVRRNTSRRPGCAARPHDREPALIAP